MGQEIRPKWSSTLKTKSCLLFVLCSMVAEIGGYYGLLIGFSFLDFAGLIFERLLICCSDKNDK